MVLYVPMNYSTEIDGQSQTADDIRPARDIGYSAVPEPWSSAALTARPGLFDPV